jgi:hypothetical protein
MSTMIEVKTSELTGPALGYAVAQIDPSCEGLTYAFRHGMGCGVDAKAEDGDPDVCVVFGVEAPVRALKIMRTPDFRFAVNFRPWCDWAQGGPIIGREKIEVGPLLEGGDWYGKWRAVRFGWEGQGTHEAIAKEPLVAAMRCYVASKKGDVVMVPAELVQQ